MNMNVVYISIAIFSVLFVLLWEFLFSEKNKNAHEETVKVEETQDISIEPTTKNSEEPEHARNFILRGINKVNISIVIFSFLFGILVGIIGTGYELAFLKENKDAPKETMKIEETAKPSPEPTPEVSKEPEYVMYFDEEDVIACARMLWGEARGCDLENQIGCVWIVCNRVDDPRFPDTIKAVIQQPGQFHGYSTNFPATDELKEVARDVLTRWSLEKQGAEVERELHRDYLFFYGDGVKNHFRKEY